MGQVVYNDLPFSLLSIEEQCRLLHHILEETSERQLVANIKKDDVDRIYYEFIIEDDGGSDELDEDMFKGYEPLNITNEMLANRMLIRDSNIETSEVINELILCNRGVIEYIFEDIGLFYILGLEVEWIQHIKEYIDYAINDVMQFINYRIINASYNKKDDFLSNIVQIIIQNSNNITINPQKPNGLDAKKVSEYFSHYRTHQSRLNEVVSIYNALIEEIDNNPSFFDTVQEKYIVQKPSVSESQVALLQEIITEDTKVNDYKDKLLKVQQFINIMRAYGVRECYDTSLQDLKVYMGQQHS